MLLKIFVPHLSPRVWYTSLASFSSSLIKISPAFSLALNSDCSTLAIRLFSSIKSASPVRRQCS